ncbi:MAG: antibiotic biosynthesis monooxygenase [Rhodospirillaceae bacterium]|nr:antibiotic biosynthesis monooxygenase [Rhodospirillaceae bacterium]|tara:strand:- start:147 stop:491 length:345 start_codon:yes stop_codon:yes gene_type:complete
MIAVIFEVEMLTKKQKDYIEFANQLMPLVEKIDGFISIERFESLTKPGRMLSLSFWRDEMAVAEWRNVVEHRKAQKAGIETIFSDYRIRIGDIKRDYGMHKKKGAPQDSKQFHS